MNNIATSYSSTKQQVEQSQSKISQVGEWINNGLNASKVMITTSDENEVTVNNYGINLKDMSDEGNYGSFQTRLIGKGFFFTTDDWETVATALGQIYIKDSESDGHWATGLIADNIIGQLIAGQSLKITNDKGSVVIDGDTAKFTDISIHYTDSNGNYVHIGGDSSRIFSIGSNGVEQMYFNSDTNRMVFSGDVNAANITGGSINGTTINIGGGNFTVDINGNMVAKNGEFYGNIKGGSININNVFTVDSMGYMKATSGQIADFNITNGELSYGNFGFFGDTAQFMNISPRGKVGTIYLDSSNYIYGTWAFASTGFGATDDGHVYANSMNVLNCNGLVSQAVPNVAWVNSKLNTDAIEARYVPSTGSYGGGAQLIKFSNAQSGLLTAATAQYVQNYVQKYVDAKANSFYNAGYSKGLSDGENIGYNKGYSAGYAAGAASAAASSSGKS